MDIPKYIKNTSDGKIIHVKVLHCMNKIKNWQRKCKRIGVQVDNYHLLAFYFADNLFLITVDVSYYYRLLVSYNLLDDCR